MEDNFYEVENMFSERSKNYQSVRAVRAIIRGLKDYIDSPQYQGTDAPKNILKKYEQRLSKLESENLG
jgi:hypothetical protein